MIQKILFLRPGKLGDMIVATPLFNAIKKRNSAITIAVAASPYNEIIIRHNRNVDTVRVVNYHSLFAVIKMILWIRKEKFDWVIDLTPGFSRTSTLISRMVRSDKTFTAGMHKGTFARYFDLTTDNAGLHIIDRNKFLVEAVIQEKFENDLSAELHFLPIHKEKALQVMKKNDKRNLLVGINCSAGEAERQWDREKYTELVARLIKKYDNVHIVLFAVGKQCQWAQELSAKNDRVTIVAGVDFLTVAAVVEHLSMLFSPDTSLIHIAAGLKLPVVGLYSTDGENLIRWRARGCESKELVALKTHNVNEISVDDAFSAICEIIDSKRNDKK